MLLTLLKGYLLSDGIGLVSHSLLRVLMGIYIGLEVLVDSEWIQVIATLAGVSGKR